MDTIKDVSLCQLSVDNTIGICHSQIVYVDIYYIDGRPFQILI